MAAPAPSALRATYDTSERSCGLETPRLTSHRNDAAPSRGRRGRSAGRRARPPGPAHRPQRPAARPGPLGAADGPGPGAGASDREAEPGRDAGPGGGAGPRPRRRPGLRAGPELTFVLGHQPLERRPRHRPGNSCAVRPRLRSARILPPEAGAASGSPAGHRSPSGARGARAQRRRAARAVPRGPAPAPPPLCGANAAPAPLIPVGPGFPRGLWAAGARWVRRSRLCRHTGRRSVRRRTDPRRGGGLRAGQTSSRWGFLTDPGEGQTRRRPSR